MSPSALPQPLNAHSVATDDPGSLSDSEIIRRVMGGEANAFEHLIKRYSSGVMGIVRRHVPTDRVEEVAHDAFVQAFGSLGSFSLESPFGHWLSKIAVRCCYSYWREHYRSREMALSSITADHQKWLDDLLAAQSVEAFETEARRRESREVLSYALGRLSPEDRMAVSLVYFEGLSVKEAADQLGWSVVGVKVRVYRARLRMRKTILSLLGQRGRPE